MSYAIVWFRRDLRLQDNPALRAALDAGHHPIPLYIDAPHEEGEWTPGAASRTWRHRSLAALEDALRALGSGLVIRAGDSAQVLDAVIAQTGAVAVYWNRKYEPATQPRDAQIKRALRERGIEAQSCNCALLFEPWQLSTQQGGPYKVFTPFWRNALTQLQLPATAPAPRSLPPLPAMLKTDALDTLQLVPSLNWDQGFWEHWHAGEAGAHEMLEFFIDGGCPGIAKTATAPIALAPRNFRRICTSARLRRGALPARWKRSALRAMAQKSMAISASWAGAISPITCCITSRTPPTRTSIRASKDSTGRRSIRLHCRPGSAAAPASRSSMPVCVSSGTPAGCTTACA